MKDLLTYTDRVTLYAIILIAIGITLRYFVGKRRFNRCGIAGLQQFSTYKQALLTTALERLLNIIATLMIGAGIILYLIK